MKKYFISLLVLFISSFWSLSSFATDLLQVYRDAQQNDPTFKSAEAQWLATQQLIPINRAALLPSFVASGFDNAAHTRQSFADTSNSFNQSEYAYALTLNQTIFNWQYWKLLSTAKSQVKQAQANFYSASQDLMLRVSSAYFAVLQAYETLQVTQATKRSLAEQFHQTHEQFKVGLIANTGVEQVQASYDNVVAQEIANKNNVSNKLEELRAITGIFYTQLDGLRTTMPLVSPKPENINAWVGIAASQNYAIKAAYYAMMAARENIKVQRAGHLPVVTGTAQYSWDHINNVNIIGNVLTPVTTETSQVGVNVNFPVYQGGLILAQTRQASYQYAEASAQMEIAYRSTLTQARESYLGVMSGISKIKADRQAIQSNLSSLSATKAAYTVGTNTIVDVLQQQQFLYDTQTTYATDQFNYIINTLTLKQAAGTLSDRDIVAINSWLGRKIDFSAFDFNSGIINFNPDSETIDNNNNNYEPLKN